MDDIRIGEKKAAREILSMIQEVCFSKAYSQFRIDYGSNGTRDLIIENIKNMYSIK